MTPDEQKFFADFIQSIRDCDHSIGAGNVFEDVSADIQATLEVSGIPLPSPVYVGVYPHNSFNAQACAVTSGTLILCQHGSDDPHAGDREVLGPIAALVQSY